MDRARVILGVCGGIAAYKAAELLRRLTESGHDVTVVPTAGALRFVGAATWAALSGRPVATDVWADPHEVAHVRLGRSADLVVVAPATADLLARAAAGRADDLLAAVLLTTRAPVLFAPAMHTEMWTHPATVANVALLRERGAVVLDPAAGRLTGADTGVGRLPEPAEILAHAEVLAARGGLARDLAGRRVLVTAGGTHEPVDPVRFLGNRSSGRQGNALVRAAAVRGAEVVLVRANVALPPPPGAEVETVTSAAELRSAVLDRLEPDGSGRLDAVVMAAAVADFRPATPAGSKLKKGTAEEPTSIAVERTADVLAELGALPAGRRPRVVVGFAAETDEPLAQGAAKLTAKRADLVVVNTVGAGRGFETETNAAWILRPDAPAVEVAQTTKDLLAHAVWDAVAARLAALS